MTRLLNMAAAVDVEQFLLDGNQLDIKLAGAILAADVERTMEGSSTVTLRVHDPDYWLIRNSGLLTKDRLADGIRLEIDDLPFVLAEIQKADRGMELVFYDEAIWKLKALKGARKASRAKSTRAQFVELLAKEAGVGFISPDRDVTQDIEDFSRSEQRQLGRTPTIGDGDNNLRQYNRIYPAHFIDQATGRTRLSAATVGKIAEAAGLPGLAFQQIARGESGYYPGVVQRDPGDGMVGYGLWQMTPNAWGAGSILHRKMAALGGLDAMRNPVKAAQMAKVMYDLSGLQPWTGTRYLTDAGRAGANAAAGGAPGSDGVDKTYVARYEFRRGANESSWAAMTRLAEEVGWRCFAVGGRVWFASDLTLMKGKPKLTVSEGAAGVDRIGWTWTTGRKIDEAELTVRSVDWPALPGSVVIVDGEGPADGRWLVRSIRRDLLDPTATAEVTLGQPVKPKLEPASRVVTRPSTEPAGSIGAAGSGTATVGADWTAKAVIDRIVVPLAKKHGMQSGTSPAMVDAANARHGETKGGTRSDHQGPPEVRWASDMAGETQAMASLARELATVFGIPWSGAGLITHSVRGWRFQLIHRINTPQAGDHFRHVHFGVSKG